MKQLPSIIPIFPLSGVIYFRKTNLPLNNFAQRYLDLVLQKRAAEQSLNNALFGTSVDFDARD